MAPPEFVVAIIRLNWKMRRKLYLGGKSVCHAKFLELTPLSNITI